MSAHARSLAHAVLVAFALCTVAARAQTTEIATVVSDTQGRPVADAVVIAVPADGSLRAGTRPRAALIDQVSKEFAPKVLAIAVGTTVAFPNHDDVRHHVYSFSSAKRFELPLYSGAAAQPVLFDKPGVVVLGCNIHDWMIGYIYVSESPYFAKTGSDGRAVISDLPPRLYAVRVWHPDEAETEDATRKEADTSYSTRADVAWQLKLKPETKIRRAPVGERGGRY